VDISLLFDERAIHHQLYALASAMDNRAWDALDTIIADEAEGDFGEGYEVSGRAGFVAMFRRFLGNCGPTQHLLGNILVSIDGERATSRCYVRDMHQGDGIHSDKFLSTPGEYRDQWARTSHGWRLVHRTKINLMMIGSVEALGLK